MKQLRQCFFVQVGADHAQAAGIVRAAAAQVDLAGDIVKLEPFAGGVLQNALGPQHPAVFLLIGEFCQDSADFILLIAPRGFQADVAEHFVRVVPAGAVMVVMVMMLMAMIVMVLMLMMMFIMLIIVIIVMMFMLIVIMMVMMFVFIVVIVIIIFF